MTAYFKGQPIFGPRGPAGPDGNPVGTVISYMGLDAPKDYLVCDGAEYNVADYPSLAAHLAAQFGAANHFGGDGETTFAVPDMRNLFLRGYHGEAEKQLSGDVGAKQEGTVFSYVQRGPNDINMIANSSPSVFDSIVKTSTECGGVTNSYSYSGNFIAEYTSRPVNMAVLYCIKATESYPAENVYSTEEIRIGTWIDGKPLYRKTIVSDYPAITTLTIAENVDVLINMIGFAERNGIMYFVPYYVSGNDHFRPKKIGNSIVINCVDFSGYSIRFSVEYTKTTD